MEDGYQSVRSPADSDMNGDLSLQSSQAIALAEITPDNLLNLTTGLYSTIKHGTNHVFSVLMIVKCSAVDPFTNNITRDSETNGHKATLPCD